MIHREGKNVSVKTKYIIVRSFSCLRLSASFNLQFLDLFALKLLTMQKKKVEDRVKKE